MDTTLLKKKNSISALLPFISLLAGIGYYAWVIFANEVPFDDGDGLQHFSIAQESWNNHLFFLDHWGKPLFTLLSSPFAQFGFKAFTLFNVIVYGLSVWILFRLFEQFQTPLFIRTLTPLILITIPDYSYGVVAGMTEPFFGLLILLLLWTAIREKWILFALIASFTPFARSEGMLVVLLAVPYLIVLRKWKTIPLLLTGFALYALFGAILLDQPWWYFENNPYASKSVYGSGSWYAYISSAFNHLGLIPILILPIAFFGLFTWSNQTTRKTSLHFFFFGGIYLGIIVIHSYLWAYGLRGALGLSRLATLGLPAFFALELIAIGYVFKELHFLAHAFVTGIIALLIGKEMGELELPTKASKYQKTLQSASTYLAANAPKVRRIYYFHPMLTYYLGLNTKQEHPKYKQLFADLEYDAHYLFQPGDILVRDSKFGAIEQGLPLNEMAKYPWIVPVKSWYTDDYYTELNGEPKSVIVYQVFDKKTFATTQLEQLLRHQIIPVQPGVSKKYTFGEGVEFYDINPALKLPGLKGPRQTLTVSVQLSGTTTPIYLIYDDGKGTYVSQPIDNQTTEVVLAFVVGNRTGKLFFHNPSKTHCSLKWRLKQWAQTTEPGIQAQE